MGDHPDTDRMLDWDDVEAELTSTLREACSFSFALRADDPVPADSVMEVLRRRRRRVVVPQRPRR